MSVNSTFFLCLLRNLAKKVAWSEESKKNSWYFQMNWNTSSRMCARAADRKCVCKELSGEMEERDPTVPGTIILQYKYTSCINGHTLRDRG